MDNSDDNTNFLQYLNLNLALFSSPLLPYSPSLSFPTLPSPSLPSSSLNLEKLSKNIKREKEAQSANVESQREARTKQLEKNMAEAKKNLTGSNEQAIKKKSKRLEMLELEIKEQNAELKSLGKLKESLQVKINEIEEENLKGLETALEETETNYNKNKKPWTSKRPMMTSKTYSKRRRQKTNKSMTLVWILKKFNLPSISWKRNETKPRLLFKGCFKNIRGLNKKNSFVFPLLSLLL